MEKNIKQICIDGEITKEECSYDGIGFQGLGWEDRLGAYQGSNKRKKIRSQRNYILKINYFLLKIY